MQIQQDGKGNNYIEVGNIRVTYVPKCSWAPQFPGLRIQAYRDSTSKSLHRGAEIPISNRRKTALEIIAAIALLVK